MFTKTAVIAGVLCVAIGLRTLVEFEGSRYIDNRRDRWSQEMSRESAAESSYRRRLIIGPPLDQNAASWYGLALMRMDSERNHSCAEIDGSRIRDAMRSTMCQWSSVWPESGGADDLGRKSYVLGTCMIVAGQGQAAVGQWSLATNYYLQALAFGADLSQGNYEANLVGIAISSAALKAIGKVAPVDDDPIRLSKLWNQISKLDRNPSHVHIGLRNARFEVMGALERETEQYIPARSWGLGRVIPWQALAAWRLYRGQAVLDLMSATEVDNVTDRVLLQEQIRARIRREGDALDNVFPDNWVAATASSEDVNLLYRKTLFVIQLQLWHARNGRYPTRVSDVALSIGKTRLTYVPAPRLDSYEIIETPPGQQ
jgi:hypothetical protein